VEVELYRNKARFQNPETFIEVKKLKNNYSATHYFKAGTVIKETWSEEHYKEYKKDKLLTKVNKILWKNNEGDTECQTKKKLSLKPKKKATKKK